MGIYLPSPFSLVSLRSRRVLIVSTVKLCLTIGSAFLTDATTYGLGRHIQFLGSDERSAVLRLGYIAAIFTNTASTWSKVSFALFLLRISSSGCTEWIRRGILGIIVGLNIMLAV